MYRENEKIISPAEIWCAISPAEIWCAAVEGIADRCLRIAAPEDQPAPHVHVVLEPDGSYSWDVCYPHEMRPVADHVDHLAWNLVHLAMIAAEPLRPSTLAPSAALAAALAQIGRGRPPPRPTVERHKTAGIPGCPVCAGSGWADVEGNTVEPCECRQGVML